MISNMQFYHKHNSTPLCETITFDPNITLHEIYKPDDQIEKESATLVVREKSLSEVLLQMNSIDVANKVCHVLKFCSSKGASQRSHVHGY